MTSFVVAQPPQKKNYFERGKGQSAEGTAAAIRQVRATNFCGCSITFKRNYKWTNHINK